MCPLKRPFCDESPGPKRSAWQQPASCDFCRLKKIRCDKQRPCSSCIARDAICEYASVPAGTVHPTFPRSHRDSVQATQLGFTSLEEDIQEMKDRLKRVEQLLLTSSGPPKGSKPRDLEPSADIPQPRYKVSCIEIDHRKWDNLESIAASSQPEEMNYIRSKNSPVSPAATMMSYLAHPSQARTRRTGTEANRQLPQVKTARVLLEYYIKEVDCLGRVVHAPSTRNILERVYSQLAQRFSPSDESVTFLLSIFASTSFYLGTEHASPSSHDLGLDTGQSYCWKETALQRLLQIDQIFSTSLMSLQSVLIILFLLWDSEGQSTRYHTLKGLAYTKAIQLEIHNTDAESSNVELDSLEKEMKRCLWWHLTCADWLLGSAPGPQQGIYIISPHHMTVNYPANIDDEDFNPEGNYAGPKTDHLLTSMSFFLYRIKFAQLCREAMDTMDTLHYAKTMCPSQPIYRLVLDISDRYLSFVDELPWFFRLDGDEVKCAELAQSRPYVRQQCAVLLYGIYSRLGRLHRPFVTRGIADPAFSTSYKIGIECAEKLLRIRRMTAQGQLDIFGRSRSVDQHSFNAMLLLTMDAISYPNLPNSMRRRCDIIEICHILKDKHIRLGQPANGISRAAQMLLEIILNPNRHHLKDGIDNTAQFFSNTTHGKDGATVPNLYTSLNSDESTTDASHQMPWIDESLSSCRGQDTNTLFDELGDTACSPSDSSWKGFFNWEGLS